MSDDDPPAEALESIRVTDPPSRMALLQRDALSIVTVTDPRTVPTALDVGDLSASAVVAGTVGLTGEQLAILGGFRGGAAGSAEVPLVDLIVRKRVGGPATGETAAGTDQSSPRRRGGEARGPSRASLSVAGDQTDQRLTRRDPSASVDLSGTAELSAPPESRDRQRATHRESGLLRLSTTAPPQRGERTSIAGRRSLPVALTGPDHGSDHSLQAEPRPAFRYRQPAGRNKAPGRDGGVAGTDEPPATQGADDTGRSASIADDTGRSASIHDRETGGRDRSSPTREGGEPSEPTPDQVAGEPSEPTPEAGRANSRVPGSASAPPEVSTPVRQVAREPGPGRSGRVAGGSGPASGGRTAEASDRGPGSVLSAGRLDPGPTAVSTPIRPGPTAQVPASTTGEQRLIYRSPDAPTPGERDRAATTTEQAGPGELPRIEPPERPTPGLSRDTTVQRSSGETGTDRAGDGPSGRSGAQPTVESRATQPTVDTATGRTRTRDQPDRRTVPPPAAFTYLSRPGTPEAGLAATTAASGSRPAGREATAGVTDRGRSGGRPASGDEPVPSDDRSARDRPRSGERQSTARDRQSPFPGTAPTVPTLAVRVHRERSRRERAPGPRDQPDTPETGDRGPAAAGDDVDTGTAMPVAVSRPPEGGPAGERSGADRAARTAAGSLDYLSPSVESATGPAPGARSPQPGTAATPPGRDVIDETSQGGGRPGASGTDTQAGLLTTVLQPGREPREPAGDRRTAASQLGEPGAAGPPEVGSGPAMSGIEPASARLEPAVTPVGRRGPAEPTDQQDSAESPAVRRTVARPRLPVSEPARTGIRGENLMQIESSDRTVRSGGTTEMPSLTLQATETGGTGSGGQDQRGQPPSEPEPQRERSERPPAGSGVDRAGSAGVGSTGPDRPGSAGVGSTGPDRPGRTASRRGDRSRAGRGRAPPEGRETATLYPDLTVKTLAPRIDVTRREEPERDVTHRSRERGRDAGGSVQDIDEFLPGSGIDAGPSNAEMDRLVEKLHRRIERKMRIERERRGL